MSTVCYPPVEMDYALHSLDIVSAPQARGWYLDPFTPANRTTMRLSSGTHGSPVTVPDTELNRTLDCYRNAAVASAHQMAVTRDQRLMAKGAPPLIDTVKTSWFNGWSSNNFIAGPNAGGYMGDYALSLLQLYHDDLTAQNPTLIFEPLKSPDDILPYNPGRLSQVELTDTYNALRHTEENALEILAQTQRPEDVARISTTQTVTDPLGRLVTGAIVQQSLNNQAIDTVLPSAHGVGAEGVGVDSGAVPSVMPGTPPVGGPSASAEQPAAAGGGWIAIALPIVLLLLPKK